MARSLNQLEIWEDIGWIEEDKIVSGIVWCYCVGEIKWDHVVKLDIHWISENLWESTDWT